MWSREKIRYKLNVSANYVPKIAKKLKDAKIVTACEGTNGGYMLAKQPENISLISQISEIFMTVIHNIYTKDVFHKKNSYICILVVNN